MRDQDDTATGRLQHETGNEASDEPPTVRMHAASVPIVAPRPSQADAVVTPGGQQSGPSITPPTAQPGGGLNTYLGEPSNAEHAAQKARAAQDSAQADTASVARSLAEIASVLHDHAAQLERFVEGSYSADLADPRSRALAQSLSIARQADLHLARLGNILRRLSASVQVAQSNLDALQRERERLSTLYHIAQELNSSLDLEDLLGSVTAELIEVVRAERGFLMLWDEAAATLRFMAARGADGGRLGEGPQGGPQSHEPKGERGSGGHDRRERDPGGADFNISYSVVERVWQSQEPLLTVDAQDDTRLQSQVSVIAYGIRSVMCAPLRVKGHGVGIVYVDSRSESALFDATHLDLLAAFCNQAAIAIENARLFADLRRHIREISAMKTYTDNIFASIASGVVTADVLGVVTAFNRAAERIFGLVGTSAVGRPYQEVLASIGDEELAEIMQRAVAEREVTLGHEIARRLPARGEVALRLNVSPLRSSEGAGEALGVAMVVDDLTELRRSQRQAREIQRLFGRYVHPAVVRQLLADPSAVNLGGETREISVVFADIRGYTRLAEQAAPGELMRLLNAYLNILTEAIWQEEGTLTMFIGDALMAIFNAPLPQPDHPLRAVRAAWAMRQALERQAADVGARHASPGPEQGPRGPQGHDQGERDPGGVTTRGRETLEQGLRVTTAGRETLGQARVEYGIGVHTGIAVVGNIGAADRLQNYTAIGDAVNTAQRLQSNASANQILLSSATYLEVAQAVVAQALEPLTVKGKTRPLTVYQLDGLR